MTDLKNFPDIFRPEQDIRDVAESHWTMFLNSPAITLLINPKTRKIVAANPSACQFYGYAFEEMRNKSVFDIIALPVEQIKKQIAHVIKGGNTQIDVKHRKSNGEICDVEVYSSPLTINDEKLLYAIVFDVTERNLALGALKRSEEKYRTIFEDSGEAIFLTDCEGKFLDVNHSMTKSLKYTRKTLSDMKLADIFSEPEELERLWSKIEKDHAVQDYDAKIRCKDNSIIEACITSTTRKNIAGEIVGYQFIWRDITEMKKGERELEAVVATVSIALRAAFSRAEIFPIILEQLQAVAHADGVFLALNHPLSGDLTVEIAHGAWEHWKQDSKVLNEEVIQQVFETDKFYLNNNALKTNPFADKELLCGLNVIVCLPISASENPFGVLCIGRHEEFPEEILRQIYFIASIASNAIYQMTLNENNLRAVRETEVIAEIGRTFNESFDLGIIFEKIVNAVVEIIPNVDRAIIHLFDEKNERLYSIAVSSADPNATPIKFPRLTVLPNGDFNFADLSEQTHRTSRMRQRQGIAGYVIAEGKTITVNDVDKDPRYLESQTTSDIRSMVVVPVSSGEKRLGTISAVSTIPNAFSTTDERLLEKLSVQATTAIENARLYEAERIQRELAEAQAESTSILNQTLELNQVLEHILRQTMRAVPCKAANIKLLESGDTLETRYRRYVDPKDQELRKDSRAKPLSLEAPLIQEMLESQEPVLIEDTKNDPRWVSKKQYQWIRSYAGIPLKLGNQIIGFLNVDGDQPNCFSQETIHRLKSFADNAAIAIQNARLYQILEDTLKQEKATRTQLMQSDKLAGMGRMVASVAHELNNPLQTIKNCLFLINQSVGDDPDTELLTMALSEVERLSDIVARLREVYRPQQKDLIQPVELKHLMADVEMLLETHLRRSHVRWIQADVKKEATVLGIADQLKQVFLNLSLNAVEAMQPDGGELHVEFIYNEVKNEIGIAFRDNGPGIPEDDIQNIFDPFFTTKETGMGLGLSICYDIAQNHNGRINVESEEAGGATFTVWLPLTSDIDLGKDSP